MSSNRPDPDRTLGFLHRLAPRVRRYWKALSIGLLFLLVSTAIGLVFPQVVRGLLDAAFMDSSRALLDQLAIGLVILFAFQAVINFGQSYLTASISERIVADLRKDLFAALVQQSPAFFARKKVGELSSRISSDTGLVQGVLRFGIPELLRQGIFLVGALVLVTITHPRLTLVTLIAVPFTVGVGWLLGKRVRRLSTGIQDRLAGAVARAEQVFVQIRTVQSFAREDWETRAFEREVDHTRDGGLRRAVARASLTGAVTFVAFGSIVLVMWEGGRLVLEGALTPGTLVAFLLYAVFIGGAVTSLAGFWSNLQEAAGAAKRIFELLDTPASIADPEHPKPLPSPLRGVVEYQDVRFRYDSDQPWVLDGISFRIDEDETVALVGPSGVGKTTTAALLPRFFDVLSGRVMVDGIDVRELPLEELRNHIGLVPQEPMLFAGTIRENLLYGDPDASEEELIQAAKDAHAHEFISSFPDGYDQLVGERGITLSAGQRQRIAIARVMLKRPEILILDEASSSLDAESESLVQDALERLMVGRTTLVIAHRLSTVLRAQRIIVLEGGSAQDQGSHAELLDRSPVYARLYKRQFEDALASSEVRSTEVVA